MASRIGRSSDEKLEVYADHPVGAISSSMRAAWFRWRDERVHDMHQAKARPRRVFKNFRLNYTQSGFAVDSNQSRTIESIYDSALVAVIDKVIERIPSWLAKNLRRLPVEVKLLKANQLNSIKGLEFQHVFVIASTHLLNELERGFSGTGKTLYNERRLLRIPFSRAKDTLVTFGLPNTRYAGGRFMEAGYACILFHSPAA